MNKWGTSDQRTFAGDDKKFDAARAVDVPADHTANEIDVVRVLIVLDVHNDA